jgi:hypothetical protein
VTPRKPPLKRADVERVARRIAVIYRSVILDTASWRVQRTHWLRVARAVLRGEVT